MMVGETPVPVGEKETDLRLRFCEAPDSKYADEMSESHIHSRFPRAHGVHGWSDLGIYPPTRRTSNGGLLRSAGTSADRGFAAVGTTRCARSARVSYEGSRAPRA